jgi:hypothetical protein
MMRIGLILRSGGAKIDCVPHNLLIMIEAAEKMVGDGWIKHAKKFRDVQKRKALKLYYAR